MEIQIVEGMEQLCSLAGDWKRILLNSGDNNPFIQFDWVVNWWRFLGTGSKMHIVMLSLDSQIIGLFPLMIGQKGFIKAIRFSGFPQANYMDLIIDPDYRRECVRELIQYLQRGGRWHLVDLQGFLQESLNYRLICQYLKQHHISHFIGETPSYFIKPGGSDFELFLKAKSSLHNSIRRIKSAEKKLNRLGRLTYGPLDTAELDRIFDLHDRRWEKKLDTSGFTYLKSRQFFKALTAITGSAFTAKISALHLGNRLLAYEYGFECNGRYLLYQIAHDNDFGIYGPGKLVIKEKIREVFHGGVQILDFSIGYERYKTEWCDTVAKIHRVFFPATGVAAKYAYVRSSFREKVVAILKSNANIVNFKRNTLGWVRFLFSKVSLVRGMNRARSCLRGLFRQYGLLGMLIKIIGYPVGILFEFQEFLIYEQKIGARNDCQTPDFTVREAAVDDIDEISLQTGLAPMQIIRRFYKNYQCLIGIENQRISHIVWLSRNNLEIPEWGYAAPLAKDAVYLFDGFLEMGGVGVCARPKKQRDAIFMEYLLTYLKKQNYTIVYIGVSKYSLDSQNLIRNAGFQLNQRIRMVKLLGRVHFSYITESL